MRSIVSRGHGRACAQRSERHRDGVRRPGGLDATASSTANPDSPAPVGQSHGRSCKPPVGFPRRRSAYTPVGERSRPPGPRDHSIAVIDE
uniref:Uncharacterized protein n=1 Tax=Plectus sambesii TaxID=2011161 RepID=A0A914V6T2_9BILA